jgi:addiction module HigA family antidote
MPAEQEGPMIPKDRNPIHPGEILQEEFLDALGISQSDFARHLGVSYQRINELVNGKRGITADTAWLLSQAFGNSAEFWMNLQMTYDLAKHRPERSVKRLPQAELPARKIRAVAS